MDDDLLNDLHNLFLSLPLRWYQVICAKARFPRSDAAAATHLGIKRTTYSEQLKFALRAIVYNAYANLRLCTAEKRILDSESSVAGPCLVNPRRQLPITAHAEAKEIQNCLDQFRQEHPEVLERAFVDTRDKATPPHVLLIAPKDIVRVVAPDQEILFALVSQIVSNKTEPRVNVRLLNVDSRKQFSLSPKQIEAAPQVDYRSRAKQIINAWREFADAYLPSKHTFHISA